MKWFKRYAIGGLIFMFVTTAMYASNRPGKDLPIRTILTMAAVWPITTAIVLGDTIGEIASDGWDAEKTVARLK